MYNLKHTVFLSNDQIRAAAPSAFAESPHHSRSERYAFIPTSHIIDAMRDSGFAPVRAMQSKTRVADKVNFTKHMITFRRTTDTAVVALGDLYPEVTLVNSHGGESAYNLLVALFRGVCLNGCIAKLSDFDAVKIPHSGKVIDRVLEGSSNVLENADRALTVAADWSRIALSPDETLAYGHAAAQLRWDGTTQKVSDGQVTTVRRPEDAGSDLWRTFNRAQETLIRGGIRTRSQNAETGRIRRGTARAVNSIDGNVGLNQALWTLTAEMAKLKQAA